MRNVLFLMCVAASLQCGNDAQTYAMVLEPKGSCIGLHRHGDNDDYAICYVQERRWLCISSSGESSCWELPKHPIRYMRAPDTAEAPQ